MPWTGLVDVFHSSRLSSQWRQVGEEALKDAARDIGPVVEVEQDEGSHCPHPREERALANEFGFSQLELLLKGANED